MPTAQVDPAIPPARGRSSSDWPGRTPPGVTAGSTANWPLKFLIRDRDTKFTSSFDEVFWAESIRIIRTPIKAPQANAFAERLVGTVRRECLDRTLIFGRRHLERFPTEYVVHYNQHRPHRALGQLARLNVEPPPHFRDPEPRDLRRSDAAFGLIHEYRLVA